MTNKQKLSYEKKVAQGLLRRGYWATKENHEKVKQYVKRLNQASDKKGNQS